MAKKKKESKKIDAESEEESSAFANILHTDAKKSLLLVFLITFGLLSVLGFFDAAGLLGTWIDSGIGTLFGYGKWLLPALLFSLSGMMLIRKTTTTRDAVKYVGLIVIYLTILGLIHLFLGTDTKTYLKIAEAGEGGGYIGYAIAAGFFVLAGKVAGVILLLAFLIAGLIMTFNMSLIGFLEGIWLRLRGVFQKSEVEEELLDENGEPIEAVDELVSEEVSADPMEEHNIMNLEFLDDTKTESFDEEDEEIFEDDEEDESVPVVKKRRRSRYVWELPPQDLLESNGEKAIVGDDIEHNKSIIQKTLKYFGIEVEPGEVKEGPTVTQYTFTPALGVKISRITTLNNDLALALAKHPIRIEAPIPGKSLIGIEVPNKQTAKVRLRNIIDSREFKDRKGNLMVVLGQDVSGKNVVADLQKMPHLLIAGRTGSGKSVCINTLLLSLLYQNSPQDLKLILVDPKRVELATYKGIPHLQTDVIVDMKKVVTVLKWAVAQMERRYKVLEDAHCRDLAGYQERVARGDTKTIVSTETNTTHEEPMEHLPYMVIVIDEVADLMAQHGKEVEAIVSRLTAKSRAVGIHLVLATQRPEATVITGLIKANIPARIAFQLKSHIDSRTILDAGGAEKLLGSGDMLYAPSEGSETKRIQGVFVSEDEVKRVTNFIRKQKEDLGDEEDDDPFSDATGDDSLMDALDSVDTGAEQDDMYIRAREVIINSGKASTTSLQTVLGIGYPKAARLMNLLEENGIVGMIDGKKKVLVGKTVDTEDEDDETEYGDEHVHEQGERDKWQV